MTGIFLLQKFELVAVLQGRSLFYQAGSSADISSTVESHSQVVTTDALGRPSSQSINIWWTVSLQYCLSHFERLVRVNIFPERVTTSAPFLHNIQFETHIDL